MFDTVEPETKSFLKNILKSISFFLGWMFFNVVVGVFMEYGDIGKSINIQNIIFYSITITVLIIFIIYLRKTWHKN